MTTLVRHARPGVIARSCCALGAVLFLGSAIAQPNTLPSPAERASKAPPTPSAERRETSRPGGPTFSATTAAAEAAARAARQAARAGGPNGPPSVAERLAKASRPGGPLGRYSPTDDSRSNDGVRND
jgi:hypothetical protein